MTNSESAPAYVFASVLSLTIVIYVLRGLGVMGFIPGGTLWVLILLTIGSGIFYGVQKTRR
ncbi:MAG: hypothetical protein HC916_04640 [Coleofasciculaceae cyanobacterium SM2_1_6]|nr:hypothetical protein [Coleofasciculaceae cyanobacterium SM2_1_6]